MTILVDALILIMIILTFTDFLNSNKGGDPSILYATYGSYPIVGHLFAFIFDRNKLLVECAQRYGQCFRIKVFNQYYTIVLSHNDWTTVIQNQSMQSAGIDFGIKIFDLSSTFLSQPEFDVDSHRLHVQHFKNRDGLTPTVVEFVRRTRELMRKDKAKLEKNYTGSKWISSGLLDFSHHLLFEPSTLALSGENDFKLFDKGFHHLYLSILRWIRSHFLSCELQARSRLFNLWIKHWNPSKASELHQDRLAPLSDNSKWLSNLDYGAFLTAFFWASLGNTIPAVFWSLFYILRDEKALATIKEEMDKNLSNIPLDVDDTDEGVKDWTAEQLDSCVYLESAINETLRLVGAPFMTRKCIRETQIALQDGRTITVQPNETLAWFGGVTHYDANMFPEPTEFIFDRFLNKKADTVSGFMPFGAGKSICPGRFFAKYEIKTCVAMLLRYMEYKFEDTETIPSQIRARIGVGIAPPSNDIPILFRYKSQT